MVAEIDNLRNQLNHYTQENEDLRRRTLDSTEMSRKMAEYENKVALLSQ